MPVEKIEKWFETLDSFSIPERTNSNGQLVDKDIIGIIKKSLGMGL